MVLAGEFLRQRSEDRRIWSKELREAAGDIIASYDLAGQRMKRAYEQRTEAPADDLYEARNRQWGHFRMTPGAWRLHDELWEISKAYEQMRGSFTAEEAVFEAANIRLFKAITGLEDGVRRLIDRSEPSGEG